MTTSDEQEIRYQLKPGQSLVGEVPTGKPSTWSRQGIARITAPGRWKAAETPPVPPVITPTPTPLPPVPDGLASGAITLQQAIDQAPAGSSIGVPPKVFTESVTIGKALTVIGYPGAYLDLVNLKWGVRIRASGVRWLDIPVTAAKVSGPYEGAIDVRQCDRATVRAVIYLCNGAGVYVEGGTGHDISVEAKNVEHTGVHMHKVTGSLIHDAWLHHNGGSADVGNESGGAKLVQCKSTVVRDVRAESNRGPGIWWDGFLDATGERIKAHDNTWPGVFFEAGARGTLTDSQLYRNWKGQDPAADTFHTGALRVNSCQGIKAHGNIFAHGISGVTLLGQARPDGGGAELQPPRPPYDGNDISGNVISGMSLYAVKTFADPLPVTGVFAPNETNVDVNDPRIKALV